MSIRHRFLPFLVLCSLLFSGAGCGTSKAEQEAEKPVKLKVWRVFDEENTLKPVMDAYQKIHPNVSFEYRILRSDEYENELIRAFATGTGPDIFSIHNTWVNAYKDLIFPLPETLKIPYSEMKGTIKKEKVTTVREEKTITPRQVKDQFVDAVAEDVVQEYQSNPKENPKPTIFGLPLSVDTLALFYNKDLLNTVGIAEPPKTWKDFQDQTKKLTRFDNTNKIIQSGAAIGTSKNVERAFDILSVLMMQNGTTMADNGHATFATETDGTFPGTDALRFYTDFANPTKEVYSWNTEQTGSFQAFASGKTAFFLGYSYHIPLLKAQAPKLNMSVTTIPQIISDGRIVNYANYWVETVAKASKNTKWAWDFIQFVTGEKQVPLYLDEAKKPTARRSLIIKQMEDEDINVFVGQLLTAKSWYRGKDMTVVEQIFNQMIDDTLAGTEKLEDILKQAQTKVNQTY
ncbi:MAG: CUT1 family carbohydrate ABC transporter, TC 3.A.1.1.-, substrate-binding protein [Candidatus Uhrbacteria bacterium GW2011_GWF2_41_16]|uniref:CUT1 family carbohydrate ABC transporter, TC 3.A.1.1.-, substrate-binding protein n=2 Tax=Candidatus Uhriibacteriota TaxID=1752732 RepID=A0A0G0YBQ2_9BACT|nr:MAG: CUT1 family carbohydrate ABC transporter, TC 3.A.1.1.-, substrate-binding protein [Candidatus Uhrbacteria bacterium GW2011_GWC2_41_11]KKR97742.1 MAG: CUT1 family carbohydrate ABC transporter, TC 3.A.1.1.-, substrate-binding protein [Candidatus Uhrbacteria bacterium GW2011_GWF2_41_16]